MGPTLRRRARRGLFAASAGCLLLALAVPVSSAQEDDLGPRPDVFTGAADAMVASVQVDRADLIPVPDLFRFIALDGSSQYETSTRHARASILYPGNGVRLGPSLLCGTFGAQFPPELQPVLDACLQYQYPLTVEADDLEPDRASSGSLELGAPDDPVSANAVRAEAHAGEGAATSDAVVQDLRVLGLPAFGPVALPLPGFELDTSLLTVDSAASRTRQRIEAGSLVVDAEAVLSGVRMVGGLIRIGSLRSVSHVTDDAAGRRAVSATLEVSGVTVGGVPAQITDQGLVVGTPSGASGPLAQQQQAALNDLLRAYDVQVSVLPFEKAPDQDGAGVASVGGLLVELSRDVQGLPTVPGPIGDLDPNGRYVASILLGVTGAKGRADTFGDEPLVEPLPGTDFGLDGGGLVGDDGGSFDAPALADAPAADVPAAPSGTASRPEVRTRFAPDLFGDRLGLVYLALMFSVLAACLTPRLTLPARLPGGRP